MYIWLRLFCFVFKTFLVSRKFSENDFWKIVSTSYRNGRIFGGRSLAELSCYTLRVGCKKIL